VTTVLAGRADREILGAMNRSVRRLTASAILASASLMAASVAAATSTSEPPTGSAAAGAAGCAEVGALLDSQTTFGMALLSGDAAAIEAGLAELSGLATAATAAAPADVAGEVETLAGAVEQAIAALDGVDLTDTEAMLAALEATEDEATADAFPAVIQWAVENCGYVQADPFADAGEPPDCETLDAAAAASAAGIDVDVTDLDGSADVNLPGFWTKSCSYGNGAMSVSTLSFTSLEDAQRFYADNLDVVGGVVLDVDVGALPASTLVIQTGAASGITTSVPGSDEPAAAVTPSVQVAVFEAVPIPFSVTFTGEDVDPSAVVAAAEALFAAPTPSSEPPPSVATTTA
jgi:hypothetical protein